MTISSTTSRAQYDGDGSTTAFATVFEFLQNSHVEVILRSALGVETTWVEGSDYTLTGAGSPSGGTVTAVTAPAAGTSLTIVRAAPYTQGSALPLGGPFPSTTVEQMADLGAMRDQQLAEQSARSLRFPVSDPSSLNSDLPSSVERASTYLAFDSDGNPIAAAPPEGGNVVSAFVAALLDDADSDAFLDTLGARFKVGTFTRDTSTAAGSQVVTGVGFKPRAIIFLAGVTTTARASIGFSDGTNHRTLHDHNGVGAGTYGLNAASAITIETDGSNLYRGSVSSFDSDGFTMAWTKTGSPTGTADIYYLALR